MLPLVVWVCPLLLRWWLQNDEMGLMIAASIVPSVALVVRYYMAMSYIKRNHCGRWTRWGQAFVLRLALLYLVCFESLLVMLQDIPAPAKFDPAAVLFIFVAYLIYLIPMTFVLYPGQPPGTQPVKVDPSKPPTRPNYFGGEDYL